MPATLSYPGVYVEEIPSGVRTITGVPTSVTAFIGRAVRGSVNDPVPLFSYGDYERVFGGLWADSPMSYAVRDYFLNGGGEALVVRLFRPDPASPNDTAQLSVGGLNLLAASPGAWGANLRARTLVPLVDARSAETRALLGLGPSDALFTLQLTDTSPGGASETFLNLTLMDGPRRIDKVLKDISSLVRFSGVPDPKAAVTEGVDAATQTTVDAKTALAAAKQQVAVLSAPVPTTTAADAATAQKAVDGATSAATSASRQLTAAQNAAPPVPADLAAAQTAADAANVTLATAQLTLANTNLVAAQKAAPPVPADIKSAQDAVAAATVAFGAATGNAARSAVTRTSSAALTNPAAPVSDGLPLDTAAYQGSQAGKTGLYALEKTDIFNLLCIPPPALGADTPVSVYQAAMTYCVQRRALLLVDPPANWASAADITANNEQKLTDLNLSGTEARNAALYFPRVLQSDPQRSGQIGAFVPCGIVAGVMSRTDTQRGVWKAPAGLDASLNGTLGLEHPMTNGENGLLNPLGVNCLRNFPVFGSVVWGARTLRGADQVADEYKYVPVRRLALFIEESLYRGTQWVVFEPNDEPLWAQIRLNVGAFMQNLFRQGAFQGGTPRDAYFVKCDKESTTQNDINLGIVNIVVGFAPLKPAEFVVLKLQQMAGQIDV